MPAWGERTWAGFLGSIACCLLAPAAPAPAQTDVLDRPAVASTRARDAVLLGVTRAGDRLVVTGERGIILLSDDGGASWTQAAVPVSVSLTSVDFANPREGWAVGHSGVVLHSTDGGRTWTKQLDGRQAAQLVLAAATAGARAGDRGAPRRLAEARRLVDDGPDKPFLDVSFVDERRGFVVGAYGLFFATEDGGRTWMSWQDRLDNPGSRHFYGIGAAGRRLYLAGEQGAFYRSSDGGRSFVAVATPYAGSYFGVLPLGDRVVLVHGLRGNAYRSDDAGRSWRRIETGESASLTAGLALDDGSVVLVTQGGQVLRSTDQGLSFRPLAAARLFPLTAVIAAPDGGLVLAGARGIVRVDPRAARGMAP